MILQNAPIKIFSGRASKYIAEEICEYYGIKLGKSSVSVFKDGEFEPNYEETVRGSYVFIIQSTFSPAENLLELLMMIDAAKRASAYKIIAVMPYFGFARQDRKDKPRVSIGAKLIANLLTSAGVSRIITMDLHADQIQGFFDVPVDHLYASSLFIPYIKMLGLDDLVIASPDAGGSKRANAYAKFLNKDLVICHKTRKVANQIEKMTVIGDVNGKNVIMIDDMIDTAGTICTAAKMLKEKGAKCIRVIATHPVLSGDAFERIESSEISEIVVTNSIVHRRTSEKITVLSIADLFSDVIKKIYNCQSISSNFIIQ